jgi:hypothetical protein
VPVGTKQLKLNAFGGATAPSVLTFGFKRCRIFRQNIGPMNYLFLLVRAFYFYKA